MAFNPDKRGSEQLSAAEQRVLDKLDDLSVDHRAGEIEKRKRSYSMEDMDEFADVYDAAKISKDKNTLRNLREKHSEDKTERARLLEGVITHIIDRDGWFGDNCTITPTLEFDDRTNHTDFVVEWKLDDGEAVRLGLDCTVADSGISEGQEVLKNKARNIKLGLKKNTLGHVDYYKSSDDTDKDGKKDRVDMLPGVIVNVEKSSLPELCDALEPIIQGKSGAHREFAQYYLQLAWLEMMRKQLQRQLDLIDSGRIQPSSSIGGDYARMRENIAKVVAVISEEIGNKRSSLDAVAIQRADDLLARQNYSFVADELAA